jgi:probable F420-dependent oxidoreductase
MIPFPRLAREAEDRGFDLIVTGEHSHIPVSSTVDGKEGIFPEHYKHFLDPFTALAAAAMTTERIRLGTAVCLLTLHDPLFLSKTVSTLDWLCGGRFVFGTSYAYQVPEMLNHGIDPKDRRAIFREKVLAMQELWSRDTASFNGEFVSFSESWQYPKPVQKPHPPLLIGAPPHPVTFRHIVEFADGWMPVAMYGRGALGEHILRLREQAAEAGRDPATIDVTVLHTAEQRSPENADSRHGARPVTLDLIAEYADMGVTTLCLPVPSESAPAVLSVLDRYARDLSSVLNQP